MIKDIDFKETFLKWLDEITLGSKELYYKIRIDEKDRFSIYLYTYNNRYCISCKRQYLGGTSCCRKSRAGEDWTRGHDLPDGNFCRQTWESIKNSIIKTELEQVCQCCRCRGFSCDVDVVEC